MMVPITAMITETKMIAPMTSRMTRSMTPLYGVGSRVVTGPAELKCGADLLGRISPNPAQDSSAQRLQVMAGDAHLAAISTDSVVCATWS
jgi:hypothetical protein